MQLQRLAASACAHSSLRTTHKTMLKSTAQAILVGILFTLLLTGCSVTNNANPANLLMGNPSEARHDTSDKDNYLMEKKYFTLSYNNSKGTPNWVSWHLG